MFRTIFLVSALCPVLAFAQATTSVLSAGYEPPAPTPVAFGQIITLFVRGLNVPNVVASTNPLPTTLGGVTVAVTDAVPGYPRALPILGIRALPEACGASPSDCTAVTVQIPFELTCEPFDPFGIPNGCTISPRTTVKVQVQANGVAGASFWFTVANSYPHLLNGCDYIPNALSSVCGPVVTHADGSLVSQAKPARAGEVVTVYSVGLGKTGSAVTGQAAQSSEAVAAPFLTLVRLNASPFTSPSQLVKVEWAGSVAGFVGLYQINVRLPDTFPEGLLECPSRGPNVRLLLYDPREFVDLCVAGGLAPQTPSKGMWASVSVPESIYVEGINTASLSVRFSLVNDGTVPLSTNMETSHLLINGVEPQDWSFIIGNGFRVAESLAPGERAQIGYGLGDRYFAKPGIYTLSWFGPGYKAADVTFRVLPKP